MKKCPKCQANAKDTANFCIKCGYKFINNNENEQICPNCKTKFTGGTFCPECGYDIINLKKPKTLDFNGFSAFSVTNLLLVQVNKFIVSVNS